MPRESPCVSQTMWAAQAQIASDRMLIIGDIARWSGAGRAILPFENFNFCTLAELSTDRIRDLAPEMIMSPLVGDNFDVLEVATLLRKLGYKGRYRVISDYLPQAQMIREEVAQVAPDLDFDLVVLGPEAP